MEDFNIRDFNQHQLIKREPTLIEIPGFVFLAPAKNGLRSPILKCKTQLASLMSIFDCHQYNAQPLILIKILSSTYQSTCSLMSFHLSSRGLLIPETLMPHNQLLLKKPHRSTCQVCCFHATCHHLVMSYVVGVTFNHSQPLLVKHITWSSLIILFIVKSFLCHVIVC